MSNLPTTSDVILASARTLIVKEIAIARGKTEEEIKTEIESIFVSN